MNAGLGNFGVTTMQILIPLVMTVGLFGALAGGRWNLRVPAAP
jgi:MFS transporter, NNP family, nitrate/nitrite transporter